MKVNNFDNPVIDRKGDIQTLEEYSERNNVIMSDEFVPDKTYNPGDFVIYKNALWKCLVTCIGVIPTEGLHWTKTSLGEVSSSLFDEIANLTKNKLGEVVNLGTYKVGNMFDVPNDGYITVVDGAIGVIRGSISIVPSAYLWVSSSTLEGMGNSVFVKKGMKAYQFNNIGEIKYVPIV